MGDQCYAPTRELTVPLRTSFAQKVSELAVKAERDNGVPAPILAAMAIDESGYGTTRVALAAKNIFSFKWISATQAGGRSAYTVSCQPPEDKVNTYIVFKDHADSIDFVAGKLEKLEAYKLATEPYKQAVNIGNERRAAATTWFNTIAPIYNPHHTDHYIAKLLSHRGRPNRSVANDRSKHRALVAPTLTAASNHRSTG